MSVQNGHLQLKYIYCIYIYILIYWCFCERNVDLASLVDGSVVVAHCIATQTSKTQPTAKFLSAVAHGRSWVPKENRNPEGRWFDSWWCRWILEWHNHFDRTMTLGTTQPLAEMSIKETSWGAKAAGGYGWQPRQLHVPIVLISGNLSLLELSGPVRRMFYF